MITPAPNAERGIPALRRLAHLAPLDEDDMDVLRRAAQTVRSTPARRDMTAALRDRQDPVLILDGWAHRSCLLADGRRQITGLLLPGDILETSSLAGSVDAIVTAVTPVAYCSIPASSIAARAGLTHALRASRAHEDRLLRRQVVRLGRFDALERITDWMLEIYERLEATGSCSGETMALPLTQETMADALGLTSVHINRMLGVLRRDNLLNVHFGRAVFLDRSRCRSLVGRA